MGVLGGRSGIWEGKDIDRENLGTYDTWHGSSREGWGLWIEGNVLKGRVIWFGLE